MRKFVLAMTALGLVSGGAAQAAERLQVPQLPDWKVVSSVSDPSGEATELVPQGQTNDTWTRRVSVQAFRGVPMTVAGFMDQVVEKTAAVCEGATAGPPSFGRVSGADAGSRTIACGRYKGDGRGTFTLFYVIRGREAFYVVSRIWRGEPFNPTVTPVSADELREWTEYVNGIELCDTADPGRPCR